MLLLLLLLVPLAGCVPGPVLLPLVLLALMTGLEVRAALPLDLDLGPSLLLLLLLPACVRGDGCCSWAFLGNA